MSPRRFESVYPSTRTATGERARRLIEIHTDRAAQTDRPVRARRERAKVPVLSPKIQELAALDGRSLARPPDLVFRFDSALPPTQETTDLQDPRQDEATGASDEL